MVLEKYGEVKGIQAETWSRTYRYPVENGIRAATVALVAHIPSHLMVAGHRSLVSYDGQPPTCYGCNETGHIYIYIYIYIYGVPQTEASGGSRRGRKVTIMGGRCGEGEDAAGGRGTSEWGGDVDEPKRSSEEPRTNENERAVEELEEIMEL
jgi:hypothetical protein